MRLGTYFINLGLGDKALPVMKKVVEGLVDALGSHHRLTLSAKTDKAILSLQKGEFHEALQEFAEIATVQEELGMVDEPELYKTLLGKGGAEHFLNRYGASLATQVKAAEGFLRLSGPEDSQYLSARQWYCYSLIELGQLEEALGILSDIFRLRRELYGDKDLFAATPQQCIGDIQRKQGRYSESIENLKGALETRRIAGLKPSSFWMVDSATTLLVALWDAGKREEALALLDELDREGHVRKYFDRDCLVTHIRALLIFDGGHIDEAIKLLQGLVIKTEREQFNRPLMWAILDLGTMLRARGKVGDEREAEMNFDTILVDLKPEIDSEKDSREDDDTIWEGKATSQIADDTSEDDDDTFVEDDDSWTGSGFKPDPPRLLGLAEQALTLVRNRKFEEVELLFATEKVGWHRPQDLWLPYGAPAADTAWMRGVA
jgi:tetratricopeptide (TPR) repeat protein